MSNALLAPKVYANTFLKLLKNSVVLPKLVSSEYKDIVVKPISNTGQKNGTTVYVKRPPMFTVRDGAVAQVQDVTEGEIAVTIDKQKGVDVEFTSLEETLSVDALLKSKIMQAKARANPKIHWLLDSVVVEILGGPGKGVTGARIQNVKTGVVTEVAAGGIFMAIGHVPNTAVFKGQLETDENGYLLMHDQTTATSVPQSGTPLTNVLVPSTGSINQRRPLVPSVRPNSSPRIASCGNRLAIHSRAAVSPSRSARVTGDPSDFHSMATGRRQ